MTSSKKHDPSQRKLDNLCLIIEKMLGANPRPIATLKEHIGLLEDLIVDLPDEGSWVELGDKYRDIVVRFWQQYENKQAAMSIPSTNQGNSSSMLQNNDEPPFQTFRKESGVFSPFNRLGGDNFQPRTYSLNLPIHPPEEEVRAALKQAFDQLDHIDSVETDFETMKELLLLVTKARTIMMPYCRNVPLESEIFSYAFGKLPKELRWMYRKQYRGKKKWLLDLRHFIQSVLDQYSLQLQMELDAFEAATAGMKDATGGENLTKRKTCFYCKYPGHVSSNCTVLKSTLCVKCLQFGHRDFRCLNGIKYVRLYDF